MDSLFFILVDAEPAAPWAGAAATWTPFLYVVASAFPGQAGILYSKCSGKALKKAAGPSAFCVFDEKEIDISKSVFLTPPHLPPTTQKHHFNSFAFEELWEQQFILF
jgi:hypothetical protein